MLFKGLDFNFVDRQDFTNLSIPIVLAVSNEDKERLGSSAQNITLVYNDKPIAVLLNIEFYAHRKVNHTWVMLVVPDDLLLLDY